ncbi:2'-5' RNA ligase family protein [Chitinophaga sp. MM2321]|uniref:2'-5' RNA ligase family protein n=1 Tax=Chitinophaga sp. MM2321 TaxID=3137178 RepID=UPI0032D58291
MQRGNHIQLTLFDYEDIRQEYFILISPGKFIIEKVKQLKKILHEKIRLSQTNRRSVAHISLFKFIYKDDDLSVINRVTRAVTQQHPFMVKLNGAGMYRHGNVTKTLILKLGNPYPVKVLQQLISREFNKRKKIDPHITIARSVLNEAFDKITVSEFDYYDEFLCDRITILKKPIAGGSYISLAEIFLKEV